MVYANLFVFSKVIIGVVFAISAISKLQDFPQFRKSIRDFQLLPNGFVDTSALLFVLAEVSVVGLLLIRPWIAFLLATLLLLIFSAALALAVVRKLELRCNCFGKSQRPISPADLIRNGGFLACSLCGIWLSMRPDALQSIAPLHAGVITFAALAFVIVWMQVSEIYQLFQA